MTRATSIKALQFLVANNLLRGKQALIVGVLARGEATSAEVIDEIAKTYPKSRSWRNVNACRGRFTELQQRGLIVEVGRRPCKITGQDVLVWRFTGRTKPLKRDRRPRGAKAWKALAMDLWNRLDKDMVETRDRFDLEDRIRALGGRP